MTTRPRTPPRYDNRIHANEDYADEIYEGEPEYKIAKRKRAYDALYEKMLAAEKRVPAIVYHGVGSYSIHGGRPVAVSKAEHHVLSAFLARPVALTRSEIEKMGTSNAPQTVRRLAQRNAGMFEPAIMRPGKKGKGGYVIRVRLATTDGE